jgi:hypothetical protein
LQTACNACQCMPMPAGALSISLPTSWLLAWCPNSAVPHQCHQRV